jgi:signal transduction histidine kinase
LGKNAGFSAKANLAQEAKDGIIYFGGNSNESYLYAYNPNSNKVENISLPLPFQTRSKIRVLDLAIDYENKVWLATSEGLLKYDKEKKEIKRVHLGVNYTYEEITAVDLMPDSSLWLSTEIFGLIRYKNNDFALFDESSGLTIKSFNQRAMLIDNEGYLWVGTPKGIEISQIPFPQPKPTNQPMVLDGENLLKKSKKNGKYIYIVSSDSKINFRFHSLTYPPVDVQYQTRIAQLGGNWSDIDESEDFVVNNLAEGDYVLQVRSKQRGGHTWSEPLNIDINVQTVWYKTAVAMFAYILILFGLIYSFIKWNERRLRLKNEHLEELIETRTREITNQKEEIEAQKDEMERVNVRLQEVNEEKNYYVGVVAHDLKSPLNRIKALIELIHLEKDVFSDSIEQYLSLISTSIDHQRAIVTDILDLQAIESQKINFNMEELAIVPFMKEVTSEFEPSANKKYLKLHFDSHISNQAQIEVDSHYFQQIVENLISNAIKFSSQGKNIFVILDEVDNHIQISVKDEGPGLSEEDKSKLFQKFQKLSARPTAGEKSNGLGLSIVKLFAESMGGKVWCESEERKGATFKVQIPKVQLQNQSAEKREVKLGKV